ncbi:MAG: Uncharacterised protein [Hyphomonas sp. TMED17]|nr:MAG: Uncharacterised protein [Hyphomonas sp. TMED17]
MRTMSQHQSKRAGSAQCVSIETVHSVQVAKYLCLVPGLFEGFDTANRIDQ